MSIPQSTFREQKEFRPSHLTKPKDVPYLNEALGSFNNQYDISKQLANTVLMMKQNRMTSCLTNVLVDNIKIPVLIVLFTNEGTYNKANLDLVGDKQTGQIEELKINVFISPFEYRNDNQEWLLNDIKEKISHELMHGNIFLKRNVSNEKLNDMPEYYNGCIEIIQNSHNSFLRDIAYALYTTYYQEAQAIVSSTYGQLESLIGQNNINYLKSIDYDAKLSIFKKYLIETMAYQTYYYIINDTCKIIDEMSEQELKYWEEDLRRKKVVLKDGLKAAMGKVKNVADGALKDVTRNGALFFNEVLNNNQNGQN